MSAPGNVMCVFGTGSDVGKSWISTGLCRLLHQAGRRVAPFKAQNMSNNAGVTPEGLEMGRAQIVQAQACGLEPHVDMNPLLLKPNTDTGSQLVMLGRAVGNIEARAFFGTRHNERRPIVVDALDRLRSRYEVIVAEGAGSCAEVNLRDRDLVNMPIAHHADAPVVLVADIHKGGVFAQLVGTLEVLSAKDRARIVGFVINRFRGDARLFEDGRTWLERRTGLPVLGVVPWSPNIRIESEDGLRPDVVLDPPPPTDGGAFHVAVLRLPHIANFTDFDALERHGANIHMLAAARDLSPYDLVIVPGTKNTRSDLQWLKRNGWAQRLKEAATPVLGLCGGFQMLGLSIDDPVGAEGPPGVSEGLGLLPVRTSFAETKTTRRVTGRLGAAPIAGYEIHVGQTERSGEPLLWLDDGDGVRPEGVDAGRVMGTYVHGLFDAPGAASAFLTRLAPAREWPVLPSHDQWRTSQFDLLAAHLRGCLDLSTLSEVCGVSFDPVDSATAPT